MRFCNVLTIDTCGFFCFELFFLTGMPRPLTRVRTQLSQPSIVRANLCAPTTVHALLLLYGTARDVTPRTQPHTDTDCHCARANEVPLRTAIACEEQPC
jgi:hypothetical protein